MLVGVLFEIPRLRKGLTCVHIGESGEAPRKIEQVIGDDVDHDPFALHPAGDAQKPAFEERATEALEHAGPDDDVGESGFVLEGHEDDAARGRQAAQALSRPLRDRRRQP